jgi:deoxyribodipyrimidine photo-lyase
MKLRLRSRNGPLPRKQIVEELVGCFSGDTEKNTLPGGRTEAWNLLRSWDPSDYGRTRNFLDAPVSRLAPYLRHGMITAVEVRDHLLQKVAGDSSRLEEFLRQLSWRDFFEKVLAWHGRGLDDDIEPSSHGVNRSETMPHDVLSSATGLPCIDGILADLHESGYLHNHARLWLAAYLCHFRGVRWQEGARLFRQQLYDGDYASNSSSWQWVAGTFSAKPYFMNRENIAKFSGSFWCSDCHVRCPFDAPYPVLQDALFSGSVAPFADSIVSDVSTSSPPLPPSSATAECEIESVPSIPKLVWVHDAAMSWEDPALKANPNAAVVFVIDEPALRAEPWAFHRLAFVMDGIDDLFGHLPNPERIVLIGDPAEQIGALARAIGVLSIHLSEHPNPPVIETTQRIRESHEVVVHPRPVFTNYPQQPRRFSRYWETVAPQVLGHRPKRGKRMHQ